MTVLSLKTELDVAEILLAEGWLPEEINGILVFPLPRAAFFQLHGQKCRIKDSDIVKATAVTPTTFYRARQLLKSAGWLDRELNSLLKSCLYSFDPWANQQIHNLDLQNNSIHFNGCLSRVETPLPMFDHYCRSMALKRIGSLTLVISVVSAAVIILS